MGDYNIETILINSCFKAMLELLISSFSDFMAFIYLVRLSHWLFYFSISECNGIVYSLGVTISFIFNKTPSLSGKDNFFSKV